MGDIPGQYRRLSPSNPDRRAADVHGRHRSCYWLAPVRSVEWFANGVLLGRPRHPTDPTGSSASSRGAMYQRGPTSSPYAFVDVVGRIGTNTDGITMLRRRTCAGRRIRRACTRWHRRIRGRNAVRSFPDGEQTCRRAPRYGATDNYRWIADLDAPWNATIPSPDQPIVMAQPYVQGSPVGEPARTYASSVRLISRLPVGVVTSPSPTGNYTHRHYHHLRGRREGARRAPDRGRLF